jgi:hypothetical protein
LSEKDSRRYAAVETQKLGRSGLCYIAKVLGCSRTTIYAGLKELGALPEKGMVPAFDAVVRDVKAMKKLMPVLMRRF